MESTPQRKDRAAQVQARAGCDLEAVLTHAAAEAGLELLAVDVAADED